MTTHPSHLRLETVDDITIISFLDSSIVTDEEVQEIAGQLYALVGVQGRRRLLLNFDGVRRLSSSTLGVLMTLQRRVDVIRGDLKLCCLRPELFEIFKVTGLDESFPIYDTESTALDAF